MLKYDLILKKNLKSSPHLKKSFKFETQIGTVLFSYMVHQIQINLNHKSQFPRAKNNLESEHFKTWI